MRSNANMRRGAGWVSRTTFLLAGSILVTGASAGEAPIPSATRQLVVVIADSWDSVPARLQRFERAGDGWRAVGPIEPVVVGKRGLAWGAGLHTIPAGAVAKREGDQRAPAGVFRLRGAFGYETRATRMPFQVVTTATECVDDPRSDAYNTVIDTASSKRTWASAEIMRRRDDLYRYGLYVDHNASPPVRGAGSCIFMHVWSGPARGTAGCTAMRPAVIAGLVDWLDPAQAPLLVQLPRAEYDRVRATWELPPLR